MCARGRRHGAAGDADPRKGQLGPEQLERFNGFLAAKVLGGSPPGMSSGQAIQAVEEVAAKVLPPGY